MVIITFKDNVLSVKDTGIGILKSITQGFLSFSEWTRAGPRKQVDRSWSW